MAGLNGRTKMEKLWMNSIGNNYVHIISNLECVPNYFKFRVCSQSHQQAKLCKPEQSSRQMKESEESASDFFESHGDPAMIFDLHEKAFKAPPRKTKALKIGQ